MDRSLIGFIRHFLHLLLNLVVENSYYFEPDENKLNIYPDGGVSRLRIFGLKL